MTREALHLALVVLRSGHAASASTFRRTTAAATRQIGSAATARIDREQEALLAVDADTRQDVERLRRPACHSVANGPALYRSTRE
jgi:hypothetical protein